MLAVFVQPGGEANTITQPHAQEIDRIVNRFTGGPLNQRPQQRLVKEREGEVVGAFGVESKQQRADDIVGVHSTLEGSPMRSQRPSLSRSIGRKLALYDIFRLLAIQ